MKNLTLFDTSICTRNLGDEIIMEAVNEELRQLLPATYFFRLPTHERIFEESYKLIEQSELCIVGGTNLLSSNMDTYNQWKIGKQDASKLNNAVLMGVGWWQYQEAPNKFTKRLLSDVLSSNYPHSVRDRYTKSKVIELGVRNVQNTSCPTTWQLSPDHCNDIPRAQADEVVMTLTDYYKDTEKDKYLWEILRRSYKKVYLWTQGSRDYEYAQSLFGDAVEYVNPSVEAYAELLKSDRDLDYVGTRLHAGIYALRHHRRSIIVSVDNRATEMSKDLGLHCIERSQLGQLKEKIRNVLDNTVQLPEREISDWKEAIAGCFR